MKRCFLLLGVCCTPLEPASDTLADAGARASPWECLQAPLPVLRPEPTPERITYVVPIVDFDSQPEAPAPVPGLEISVCDSWRCEPPAPICTAALTPDCVEIRQATGQPEFVYALSFPYGFSNAVLQLRAPGYASVSYVLGGPMVGNRSGGPLVIGLAIAMPLQTTVEQLGLELGSSPAPEQRALALRTLDCRGRRASGVSVRRLGGDEQGVPFVLSEDNRATGDPLVTSARGAAGFMALSSAAIDVIGVAPSGAEFAGPTTLGLRAGVITLAELRQGLGQWGQ